MGVYNADGSLNTSIGAGGYYNPDGSVNTTVSGLGDVEVQATGRPTLRTLENRFTDVPNVLDWGVKGDGVNDDRAALQQAANASFALYFPPNRTYIIDGHLNMRSFARWYGPAGASDATNSTPFGVPKLWFTGTAGGGAIRNNNPAARISHAGISNIVMGVDAAANYSWFMDFNHMVGMRLDHIRLHSENNLNIGGIRSQRLDAGASWVNNWTQVEVYLPRQSIARTIDLNTSDSAVLGGNFTGGYGAIVRGPGAVKFVGTRFDVTNNDADAAGLTIAMFNPEDYTQYFVVMGCQIEENPTRGILIEADINDASAAQQIMAVITGCQFRNNDIPELPEVTDGTYDIELKNATGAVVRMPLIYGNSHTLPYAANQIIKRIKYDPDRWIGQPYGMSITRGEGNPTFWIGDRDRQAVITLEESGTEVTNTGATINVDTELKTLTIPGYTLGPNDSLIIEADWSHVGSTNNKILRVKLGGVIYTGFVQAVATNIFTRTRTVIRANNSYTAQKGAPANYPGSGSSTAAPVTSTLDMKLDQTLALSCQIATAGETITLNSYSVKVQRNIR